MKKIYLAAVVIANATFSLYSCKDEYTLCDLSKDVRFIGAFYRKVGSNDVLSPAPSLSIRSLDTGPFLYSQQPNVDQFGLSLSSVIDSAKFVITIAGSSPTDTVTIVYSSLGENLSTECGSITTHNITKLTSTINTIDSVKIIKAFINNVPSLNAKIYY
ncbi:MAG: DUF6452 family protein [Ferruginibacter sp.]